MRRLFILLFCAQFLLCSGLFTSLQTQGTTQLQSAPDSVQHLNSAAPEASHAAGGLPSAEALESVLAVLTDLPHDEPNLINTPSAVLRHGITATAYPGLDVAVQAPHALEGPQRPPRASRTTRGPSVLI